MVGRVSKISRVLVISIEQIVVIKKTIGITYDLDLGLY
jgi:hypothetical protein